MTDPGFHVLHQSDACLAVSKPPGLLTQAPPGIDSLEVRIKAHLGRGGPDAPVYLGVPHRLDRPASGAMVFGLSRRATRKLSDQFERRRIGKVYWALVEGEVAPAEGTWEDYVHKVHGRPQAEIVAPEEPGARQAVLHYEVLGTGPYGTWLAVDLQTGRTHQVRVQAASRGHPVLGDGQYGSTVPFGPQHEDPRLRAIALHARSLTFRDPAAREQVCVTSPLTPDWTTLGIPDSQ